MSHEPVFEDAYDPTEAEMTAWAYAASSTYPVDQDWDLIITRPSFGSLFLRLASDSRCPNRRFFLACLYLMAGDTVRTGYRTQSQQELQELTQEAMGLRDPWVRSWAQRARVLMRTPDSFSYDAWCDPTGLARTPV